MSTFRHVVVTAAACALVSGLAACSSSDTTAVDRGEQAALFGEQCKGTTIPELPALKPEPAADGTTKVQSEFGDVEIPTHPKAALGMYTTDVDILIWLRYPLASSQPIRGDSGYTTFPCFFPYDELDGTRTFANYPDYSYEGILAAKPDFILNGLGYDKDTVKRLPDIAPTYSLDAFDGESWVEHFEETAKVLGREQYFQEWKDLYDKRLAEVKQKIGDTSKITVAPAGYWEGKVNTGCYVGVECQVFEDLGLKILPSSLKNDREGEALSGEQVGRLADADYLFTTKGLGAKGQQEFDAVMKQANENALWRNLPAVEDDHVITYEMEMTYGSPSGQLAFLDVVEKALAG